MGSPLPSGRRARCENASRPSRLEILRTGWPNTPLPVALLVVQDLEVRIVHQFGCQLEAVLEGWE